MDRPGSTRACGCHHRPGAAQTLSELGGPVAATLRSASLIDASSVRENTVQILFGDERLAGCAIVALRATPAKQWPATGLGIVATCCSGTL